MSDIFDPALARVSLEYFPPKGISRERALMTGAHVLRRFNPEFQTVTFGADGSAIEGSLDWPAALQGVNEVPTAAHITLCRFEDREFFLNHASALWQQGIKRLVVLRGDDVVGGGLAGFQSVAQAIRFLKMQHDFDISVAAYPQVHPLAENQATDIDALLNKQDAGADRAITQFFFDNNDFYRFRDKAERAGFYKELVPGIIPIGNFENICEFAKKCGASVPDSLRERFAACGNDRSKQTDVARDVICEQVRDLARNGVDAVHIYTLNRVDLTADAIRAFRDEFSELSEALSGPKLALVS